ncbi:hypothetical protein P4O66_005154, partial [Electrophorus voltai]
QDATFTFNVKFYPPDPSLLAEDITSIVFVYVNISLSSRYLLCLQLRSDIMTSRLSCPLDVLAELGSYTVQSELGEYDSEVHGQGYLGNIPLAPHQTPELEDAVTELHRSHKSMTPADADKVFLQKAKSLPMYGLDLHPAKYASESTLIFNLPNYRACKSLWKTALEHHAFFRNYRQDRSFPGLLHLGSTFHFHGNTHTECLEASSSIKRPPLHVARSAIKRKETFDADQASLLYAIIGTKTYKHAHKVTWMDAESHAYGEREEGEGPNEEAGPQQLGGRSFPPQGSLSSDTNILKSGVPQSWKQHADDWYDLLNPRASKSSTWILETAPSSLQSSQLWEQRRELEKNEWEERTSEESAEVVKIMKEAQYMRDGSEGLEVETRLKRADIAGESLEMVIVGKQPIMKSMEEKLEEQEDGARLQNVVIHQQRTQEVQRYDGQPQEVFTGRKIRKVEIVGGKQELLVGGQVVSEETIEGLEKKLLELESIEQRVQDTEGLKVRFREGEILEEKLRQAEQERALRRQQDDWHILMHHRHLAAGAKTEVALQTGGIQQWEEKTLQRPNPLPPIHTEDNWHVLLNLPPRSPQESWLTLSPSASLQSSQLWEQRQELEKNEWEERTSEESAEVVKIMKEAQYMRDGSEGLEVETRVKREDIAGESLEMVIVGKQPIMKSMEEKLEEQEDGARLQNVVIHQQRTQEVQRYDGQAQDVFTGRKIRKVEIVGGKQELLVGGQVVSEETIEGLEKKLLELESIEERLQDIEGLKVRLLEVEILEEKLRQAEQERALRRQQDDWHILLYHRPLAAGAKTEVALQTGGIQQWEEKTLQRPNPLPPIHTEDNWHVLLNLPPRSPQESWLTLSPSDEEDRPVVPMVTESRQQEEERRWQDERKDSQVKEVLQVKESSQPPIAGQRASQLQREVNDDWFVQLNPSPKQSVTVTDKNIMAKKSMAEEETRTQVQVVEKPESQSLIHQQRAATPQREGHDDWFTLLNAPPMDSLPVAGVYEDTIDMRTPQIDTRVSEPVRMKGREVMIDVKPMIIEEKHLIIGEKHTIIRENPLKVGEVEKIPGALQEVDDSWFVLFDWTPFEKRSVGTEVSDTWLSEERRTKEVQERKIREEERRKQEACALLQGEASNKWFVLLETPKGVKELDRRATEERVMEEELKKRVTEEERRKRAAVDERRVVQLPWEEKDDWFILLSVSPREPALKPPPVPVMSPVPVAVPKTHPLPPADQPLTSTPTARPAPITRPTYQEERTKMQDITQESIQDITQENFDETPEVVLRHHASIRELKRLFLEDVPVFGPTEWDKRLSTHTPVKIPKVTNGDLFLGMDLVSLSLSHTNTHVHSK